MLVIGVFLAFMTFLKTGAYFLSSATIIPIRTGVVRDIRNQLYRKITSLPLGFFSEERKGDIIVTKSISRFCRNTVDLLSTVRHLKDLGVEVIFDENNISTFSYTGEMVLTFLASQAQEESRSISENVLWSIKKKIELRIGIVHPLGS